MYSLKTSFLQKSEDALTGLSDEALALRPDLADKVAHMKATEAAEAAACHHRRRWCRRRKSRP